MACRGWAVSVTQVLLMASPLSGLLKAIQERSSANFHLGMCAAGLLTSCLWAIYAMVRPAALAQAGLLRDEQPCQGLCDKQSLLRPAVDGPCPEIAGLG